MSNTSNQNLFFDIFVLGVGGWVQQIWFGKVRSDKILEREKKVRIFLRGQGQQFWFVTNK